MKMGHALRERFNVHQALTATRDKIKALQIFTINREPETDDEDGVGADNTEHWLLNRLSEQKKNPNGLYQTYFITPKDRNDVVVGTYTLTPEDRGCVAKLEELDPDTYKDGTKFCIGYLQVEKDYRIGAVGPGLITDAEDHVREYMAGHPGEKVFCVAFTKTVNESLRHQGFRSLGWHVFEGLEEPEELFALDAGEALARRQPRAAAGQTAQNLEMTP